MEPSTSTSAPTTITVPTTSTSAPTSSTEPTTTTSAPASSIEPTTTTSAPASITDPTTTTSAPTHITEPTTTTDTTSTVVSTDTTSTAATTSTVVPTTITTSAATISTAVTTTTTTEAATTSTALPSSTTTLEATTFTTVPTTSTTASETTFTAVLTTFTTAAATASDAEPTSAATSAATIFTVVPSNTSTSAATISTASPSTITTTAILKTSSVEPTASSETITTNITIADCGPLTDPENGRVNLTSGTLHDSIAMYTCNEGFQITVATSRLCQSNGNWSGSAPTCVSTPGITGAISDPSSDSSSASTSNFALGVTLGVVLAAATILGVVCLIRHHKRRRPNDEEEIDDEYESPRVAEPVSSVFARNKTLRMAPDDLEENPIFNRSRMNSAMSNNTVQSEDNLSAINQPRPLQISTSRSRHFSNAGGNSPAVPRSVRTPASEHTLLNLSTYEHEGESSTDFDEQDVFENLRVPVPPAFQNKQINMQKEGPELGAEETDTNVNNVPEVPDVSAALLKARPDVARKPTLPAWVTEQNQREDTMVEDIDVPPLPAKFSPKHSHIHALGNQDTANVSKKPDEPHILDMTPQQKRKTHISRHIEVQPDTDIHLTDLENTDQSDSTPMPRSRSASISSNFFTSDETLSPVEIVGQANGMTGFPSGTFQNNGSSESSSSTLGIPARTIRTPHSIRIPDQPYVTEERPLVIRRGDLPPIVWQYNDNSYREKHPSPVRNKPHLWSKPARPLTFQDLTLDVRRESTRIDAVQSRGTNSSPMTEEDKARNANKLKRLKKFKALKDAHKKKVVRK
ncbi:uncharacterized protein LOC127870731 [Dreissena polymorpha]|uniref:Sushi domain-containing protein n=1 Tax=Dreissena polymorpha TaxID=45954 RepID=A0A9D4QWH9_DREPO|nr:uncharacterized protein LOC127870731 [Dreissena polymorpha]KAH3844755.1 hypothetical protein DPMN_087017 [Dreissena polymorpha]